MAPLMILTILFLPLLLVDAAIGFLYLPWYLAWVSLAIVLLIGLAVLFTMSHVAKLYEEASVERYELKSIVSSLEDSLVAYDKNFRIFFFNKSAENLFDLKTDEVMNYQITSPDVENPKLRLLAQVIYPSLAPVMISRSVAGTYPQIVDLSFTDPTLELRVSTSPMGDVHGQLIGFVKIIHDRTRELELIRSKNEFITVASHQLRSPLTNVSWAFESLAQDKDLNENSKMLVENGLIGSRLLLKIIDDLLNIAKIEEGRFGYNYESTDIVEFVNRLLVQILPQAQQFGVKVYFDKPKESMPKVFIDPQKLSVALSNLLENAIRYNLKNGEVIVKVEKVPDQPYLKVGVKDTGIGVPQADIQKLFSKFFRADNALRSQTEGSGLGLYITKNIIRAHGGQIGAESEVNRGSTFYFTLPTDQSLVPQHEVGLE